MPSATSATRATSAARWVRPRLGAVLLSLGALLPLSAWAQTALPAARDLQASAARAAAQWHPLVLMFSLPGCPYCERLRRTTYQWMAKQGDPVEQLEMTPAYKLRGFDGKPTTGQAMAALYHVKLAPTVLFLGPGGQELAERLVGAGQPDFYEAFVQRAMEQSTARLKQQQRGGT